MHKIVHAKGTQVLASYDVDPVTGNYYLGIRSETLPPKGQSYLSAAAQGRLFSPDLKPLTPLHVFAAAKETLDGVFPRMFGVNFNSQDRKFLATWLMVSGAPENNSAELLGQLLSPAGIPMGDVQTILTLPRQPAIQLLRMVYNKAANEYVLLYSKWNLRQDKDHLYLQRIDHNLMKIGPAVLVDQENTSTDLEDIRLDPEMHQYLVTWQTYQYGSSSRIRAALFSSNLKRIKSAQTLAELQNGNPRTTFSAAHQGFVVFWMDDARKIIARVVNRAGGLSNFFYTGVSEYVQSARANPATGGFLLMVHTPPRILRLDHHFQPVEPIARITCQNIPEDALSGSLLYNPKAMEFLATWSYGIGPEFGGQEVYAVRLRTVPAGPCSN